MNCVFSSFVAKKETEQEIILVWTKHSLHLGEILKSLLFNCLERRWVLKSLFKIKHHNVLIREFEVGEGDQQAAVKELSMSSLHVLSLPESGFFQHKTAEASCAWRRSPQVLACPRLLGGPQISHFALCTSGKGNFGRSSGGKSENLWFWPRANPYGVYLDQVLFNFDLFILNWFLSL